jgi:hypothetical protein
MDEMVGTLIQQQQRQADALERLSAATESISRDLWSLAAGTMRVALVFPWPSQPEVFRAVLVRSADEERRLVEALPRFEKGEEEATKTRGVYGETSRTSLEEWLKREDFKPIEVTELRLGKHTGMFKAAKPVAVTQPREIADLRLESQPPELKLELESQAARETGPEPTLELESPTKPPAPEPKLERKGGTSPKGA